MNWPMTQHCHMSATRDAVEKGTYQVDVGRQVSSESNGSDLGSVRYGRLWTSDAHDYPTTKCQTHARERAPGQTTKKLILVRHIPVDSS